MNAKHQNILRDMEPDAVAVAGLLVLMRALHAGLRVCAQTVDTLEGRRL